MVNSYSISLKGTLSRWMSYSELGVFCDTVNKKIPCKIVLINSKTNFLANPKSALNTLNLNLNSGDNIEIVLISSSEDELNNCVKSIKDILKGYTTLC